MTYQRGYSSVYNLGVEHTLLEGFPLSILYPSNGVDGRALGIFAPSTVRYAATNSSALTLEIASLCVGNEITLVSPFNIA